MTFNDLEFGPRNGMPGIKAVALFPNGYGASVIKGFGTYGDEDDLYELGVLKSEGDDSYLCYDTEITSDVIGCLTEDEVTELLQRIEAL